MKPRNSRNLKSSLAIGFGTILSLLLVLTLTALSQLTTTRTYIEQLIKEYYVKTELVTTLQETIHDRTFKLQQMSATTNLLVRKQAYADFNALENLLLTTRSKLLPMNLTPDEQAKLRRTFTLIEQTAKIQQQLAQLVLDNPNAEVPIGLREQVFSAQNAEHEAVNAFVSLEKQATHQIERQAFQVYQNAYLFMSSLGSIVIFLGGFLTWLIFRRIDEFENQLIKATEAVAATNKAKKTLLANLNHQLRTPLNVVVGMSILLRDTNLNREQHELVETIHTSGDTFLKLINSLLWEDHTDTSPVSKLSKVSSSTATTQPNSTLQDTVLPQSATTIPPKEKSPQEVVSHPPSKLQQPTFQLEEQSSPTLRILLVEDDLTNQRVAQLILERIGYSDVDVANNGLEAIQALERQAYDVILMDIQMPEMDGLEATHQIRKHWPLSQGPYIVAMTANALRGDKENCLAAGMDDYVAKPVRPEELVMVLERSKTRTTKLT